MGKVLIGTDRDTCCSHHPETDRKMDFRLARAPHLAEFRSDVTEVMNSEVMPRSLSPVNLVFKVFRGKMTDMTDATRNLLTCLGVAGCLHSSGVRPQDLRGGPSYTGLSSSIVLCWTERRRSPSPKTLVPY